MTWRHQEARDNDSWKEGSHEREEVERNNIKRERKVNCKKMSMKEGGEEEEKVGEGKIKREGGEEERSHRNPWIREGHVFQQYPNSKTDGSRLEGTANTRIVAGSMKGGTRIAATGVIKESDRVNVIHLLLSLLLSSLHWSRSFPSNSSHFRNYYPFCVSSDNSTF
ncbi:hypothetical protein ANTQUA_LOCUS193 [Anthophora quadrimaculata]